MSQPSQPLVLALLAAALDRPESAIDPDRPILELGIDSIAAVTLTVQLEERLGIPIEPTVILGAWATGRPPDAAESALGKSSSSGPRVEEMHGPVPKVREPRPSVSAAAVAA